MDGILVDNKICYLKILSMFIEIFYIYIVHGDKPTMWIYVSVRVTIVVIRSSLRQVSVGIHTGQTFLKLTRFEKNIRNICIFT